MAKLDVPVVVNDIWVTGEGTLDLDMILADIENVHNYNAMMDTGCPPHGCGRGQMITIACLCSKVSDMTTN